MTIEPNILQNCGKKSAIRAHQNTFEWNVAGLAYADRSITALTGRVIKSKLGQLYEMGYIGCTSPSQQDRRRRTLVRQVLPDVLDAVHDWIGRDQLRIWVYRITLA